MVGPKNDTLPACHVTNLASIGGKICDLMIFWLRIHMEKTLNWMA
jgi:hypothetical protein